MAGEGPRPHSSARQREVRMQERAVMRGAAALPLCATGGIAWQPCDQVASCLIMKWRRIHRREGISIRRVLA